MTKEDIDSVEVIEEVHNRIDALLALLEKKGLITEEEYAKELEEIIENNTNH